jgi:outer membrane receptor protein involved in Fe transport
MIQASLIETIRLNDRVRLSAASPELDLIGANPLGDGLRVPRHRVEAQFSGTHNGLGLRANAVWTSGGKAGADSAGELTFGDRFFFNFRLFYFPASNPKIAERLPWMKGIRFLLAVDNLFDTYQHVSDRNGLTPLAYQRGLLDPIGRTVRFSIRKTIQ